MNVLYAGIDAFTVTSSVVAKDRLKARLFVSELADYLQSEFFSTETTKRFKSGKVMGWRKGSMSYGTSFSNGKGEYNILAITGPLASKAADLAVTYDDNIKVTRIDFAVDVEFDTALPLFAQDVYEKLSASQAQEDKKKYKNLKLIKSSTGDTLYSCSRESGRYGRLYDKSKDYGVEPGSGKIWRYEIELKKLFGQRAWETVRKSEKLEETIIGVSRGVWTNWGVPFRATGEEFCKLRRVVVSATTLENRFEWFCRMSKSIRSLVENGYEDAIRDMLCLPKTVISDTQSIEQLPISEQW